MIVGGGLIGRSLIGFDRENFVFLCSGVSDSKSTDQNAFSREETLVKKTVNAQGDKTIVFFSTYSVNDSSMSESMYCKCKLELEEYIKTNCKQFIIVRISNLVGLGGNPKNVFNFLFNSILFEREFTLWANLSRNLLAVDDFAIILNHIIENEFNDVVNTTLNILNPKSFSVIEIVRAIESYTGKLAKYNIVNGDNSPAYYDTNAEKWFEVLKIDKANYLNRILERYFHLEKVR